DPALLQGERRGRLLPLELRRGARAHGARQRRAVQTLGQRAPGAAAQDRRRVLGDAQRRRRAALERALSDYPAPGGAAVAAGLPADLPTQRAAGEKREER